MIATTINICTETPGNDFGDLTYSIFRLFTTLPHGEGVMA